MMLLNSNPVGLSLTLASNNDRFICFMHKVCTVHVHILSVMMVTMKRLTYATTPNQFWKQSFPSLDIFMEYVARN